MNGTNWTFLHVYGVIICIITLIFLWIRKRKKRFSIFSDNGIPGPKPSLWIGNMKDLLKMKENFDYENAKKYGNIFGYFVGAIPVLSVTDPELIKLVQVKEFKIFTNRESFLPDNGIPNPIGERVVSLYKDEDMKRIRSIVCTSFSSGKLKKMVPLISETADIFLEKISQKSADEEQFDIFPFYKKLVMDVVTRAAFGIKTDVQSGERNLFIESIARVLKTDVADLLAIISICFPETEPIPTKMRELIDIVRDAFGFSSIRMLIRSCKEIIEQRECSLQERKDLLQYMIDGNVEIKKLSSIKDEDLITNEISKHEKELKTNGKDGDVLKLTHDEIIANSIIMFAAAHETTSTTLSFASYFLASNPDLQEKTREEIKLAIGNKEEIEYDDLGKLQLLDQVIAETIRLFPLTSLAVTRVSKQPFQYKGITIPKGIPVSIPLWALHRNPDYWPDPDKFIPERFSPENKNNINASNYQPFGNGPRNCLGMRFAKLIMKFVLARLLMSYRLEDCNKEGLSHHFAMFIVNPNEVVVKALPAIL